jgi:ribonuclease HI
MIIIREPKELASPSRYSQRQRHKNDGEEQVWQIITDCSKSEQGVGLGFAVFTERVLREQLKFKLDNRCSNNQSKQLAILKALEVIETQHVDNDKHRTAVIYIDS